MGELEHMARDAHYLRLVAIVVLLHVGNVHPREWQVASNGAIKWALDCDFYGSDIGQKQGQETNVVHFAWATISALTSLGSATLAT